MADEAASSSTSLNAHSCWNRQCGRNARYYFKCSRTECPGPSGPSPPIPPDFEEPGNRRIALCDLCCHLCPFCSAGVRQADLRSVTDRPATVLTPSAHGDFQPLDGPAAVETDRLTLQQFNKQFEELANEVQKRMRALTKEHKKLARSACECPEIAELVQRAQDLLRSLTAQELQPDRDTYRWLISLYARAQNQEEVDCWASKMETSGNCSTDAYNSVIFGFAVPHGVDRADMWFTRMLQNNCVPDVKSYSVLIQACARSGDSSRADLYFQRMQAAGLKPDAVTFGHLIRACAEGNAHGLQEAEQIWKDMQQADVKPNLFTCNSMLQACAKAGHIGKASHYFNQSLNFGLIPDVATYTTMISVFIKNGDVKGAKEWFGKMQAAEVSANVVSFTCVIRVCATAGDKKNACKWLAKLQGAGYSPNEHTYRAFIICYLNRKDFTQADVCLCKMLESGVQPTIETFHTLLEHCERTGMLRQAEEWFNRMTDVGVRADVRAYNSMLRTSKVYDSSPWRCLQQSEENKKWFLKMSRSDVQPNEITHEILTHKDSFPSGRSVILIGCVAAGCAAVMFLKKSSSDGYVPK